MLHYIINDMMFDLECIGNSLDDLRIPYTVNASGILIESDDISITDKLTKMGLLGVHLMESSKHGLRIMETNWFVDKYDMEVFTEMDSNGSNEVPETFTFFIEV